MATLEDVQDSINTYNAAVAAETAAVANLNAADTVVGGAVATETATFVAAENIYQAALAAARDAAGQPAALAAQQSAATARETAENDAKQVMREYLGIP